MEEQEIKNYREHLIEWIDIFLEKGIIPQVINPIAIRKNYIKKSKIKDKIKEYEFYCNDPSNESKELLVIEVEALQELL